jgi:putative DNA primase/helicase
MSPFDAEAIAAEAVAQARGKPAAGEILGFRVLTVHELLTLELPPRETVLHPWLPSKGIAMVYGPRGIGKTHITLGAAYAIASGGRYLRWHAPKPRRVLVLDGEMPGEVLQSRLAAIAHSATDEPLAPDYLRVLALDLQQRGLDLGDTLHQDALDHVLGDAEVIFCDNISTLANAGRENEAESWLPIQEWSLRQRRAGRSIVFMHHAGKGGQQRGTSRREDVLDTVIALRRPADHQPDQGARFEVHYEKSRGFHGEDAKPFEAALGAGGWATRDLAEVDMARVAALTDDGLSVRDIAAETGFSKSQVHRLQQKAREAGLTGRAGHA